MKIDKYIPLPIQTRKRKLKYPFDKLEVGESFVAGSYTDNLIQSVRTTAAHYVNKLPADKTIKLSVRKVIENEKEVIRVWRTV